MTEGYGKWLEQAREHGLSREALEDVARTEQIVEAVAEFVAKEITGDGVYTVRIRVVGCEVAVERVHQ
jgi:hypothetical protein